MKTETHVRRAQIDDAGVIGRLFDAYRQFYRQPADVDLATRFIRERLERQESVILLATRNAAAAGFWSQPAPGCASATPTASCHWKKSPRASMAVRSRPR